MNFVIEFVSILLLLRSLHSHYAPKSELILQSLNQDSSAVGTVYKSEKKRELKTTTDIHTDPAYEEAIEFFSGPVDNHTLDVLLSYLVPNTTKNNLLVKYPALNVLAHNSIATIMTKLSPLFPSGVEAEKSSQEIYIVYKAKLQYDDREVMTDFLDGNWVFLKGNIFNIRQKCLVGNNMHSAYIIYREDSSPVNPPPHFIDTFYKFQVIDLYLIPQVPVSLHDECINNNFELIRMEFKMPPSGKFNVKQGCSYWNTTQDAWNSDGCFVSSDDGIWASCICNVKRANILEMQFIVYHYVEFETRFIYRSDADSNVAGKIIERDYNSCWERISNRSYVWDSPKTLEEFLEDLNVIVLSNKSRIAKINDSLTQTVGALLESVDPPVETGVLGIGSGGLTCFAVRPDRIDGEPFVGFAFHSDKTLWMEYYRGEDVNRNKLFGQNIEYAIMFSPSVMRQNIRCAFLVFPVDLYFQPPPFLSDNRFVVASRMVDIFVEPNSHIERKDDELLHMFFPSTNKERNTKKACAYMTDLDKTWNTNGCTLSPLLHKDVCTCKMTAVPKNRAQFIVYEFEDRSFYEVSHIKVSPAESDLGRIEHSIFCLHLIREYPKDFDSTAMALKLLNVITSVKDQNIRFDPTTVSQMINDARQAVMDGKQTLYTPYEEGEFAAVIFDSESDDLRAQPAAFVLGRGFIAFDVDHYNVGKEQEDAPDVIVNLSNSVLNLNKRYAFLVYPTDTFFRELPTMPAGHTIVTFRVVDIVLVPEDLTASSEEQIVQIYVEKGEINTSLGCAFWSDAVHDWTMEGCGVVSVNGREGCAFNVSVHFGESRFGGQYIVYDYVEASFNDELPLNTGHDKTVAIKQSGFMIGNSSRLPQNELTMQRNLRVFANVLAIGTEELMENEDVTSKMADNFKIINHKYLTNESNPVMHICGIAVESKLYGAEAVNEIYSISNRNNEETIGTELTSQLSLVAVGFLGPLVGKSEWRNEFYIQRDKNDKVEFAHANGLSENELFLAGSLVFRFENANDLILSRYLFLIYPINKSFGTKLVEGMLTINVRQIDVYTQVTEEQMHNNTTISLIVLQQKRNLGGCAHWNKTAAKWDPSGSVCKMSETRRYFQYVCTINASQELFQVLIYEHIEQRNFNIKDKYDAKLSLFIISAFLSLIGIIFIAVTAVSYPQWRSSFGNKIFLNLSGATLFYLITSLYQETHNILVVPLQNDSRVMLFNFIAHYTRLAYYNWMLVVSIQQWKGRDWTGLEPSDMNRLLWKILVLAWASPFVPLLILLTWNANLHFLAPRNLTHCVLFLIPGGIVSVINIVLMVAITIRLCRFWYVGKKNHPHSMLTDRKMMVLQLKSFFQMFFLFGIPTAFGVFNGIGHWNSVADFIFKVTDPLQGAMMFVFFICLDKHTRRLWLTKSTGPDSNDVRGEESRHNGISSINITQTRLNDSF